MAEKLIDDVVGLMRERLPSYAVNCLVAAGYDSTDAICSMITSDGSENSLTIISSTRTSTGMKNITVTKF